MEDLEEEDIDYFGHYDIVGRPRMEKIKQQILQDHEDAKLEKQVEKILMNYCGENGENEGLIECLNRKLEDAKKWEENMKFLSRNINDDLKQAKKDRQIVKGLEDLDFGVLLQSLRDDFSEDKDHVPNDVLKKMIKNTETMMNIQKTLEGKK